MALFGCRELINIGGGFEAMNAGTMLPDCNLEMKQGGTSFCDTRYTGLVKIRLISGLLFLKFA